MPLYTTSVNSNPVGTRSSEISVAIVYTVPSTSTSSPVPTVPVSINEGSPGPIETVELPSVTLMLSPSVSTAETVSISILVSPSAKAWNSNVQLISVADPSPVPVNSIVPLFYVAPSPLTKRRYSVS